jgi:hypothetical protein
MREIYSPVIFKGAGLTDPKVKDAILKEVLTDYEQRIEGAMSQTQTFVLNGIRTLQREMITENLLIKKGNLKGEMLDAEVAQFKKSLQDKYPELYRGMKEGNILVSRKFGPDGETVRHYKVDYYTDMATRTTLLNVDRDTNTIMAMVNGERIVEYFLSDPRTVRKDREICQDILRHKTEGMSLLALDDEAAEILGIMTVDEAMSTPDYAMGPYCRHSIRRLPEGFLRMINERLRSVA